MFVSDQLILEDKTLEHIADEAGVLLYGGKPNGSGVTNLKALEKFARLILAAKRIANPVDTNVLYTPIATGCSDGGCLLQDNRKGMHTNGGCQCRRTLNRTSEGKSAVRTIDFLRGQLEKKCS